MTTQAQGAGRTAETALLFGGVPCKYHEEWAITSDFELIERKLRVRIEVVPLEALVARYEGLGERDGEQAAEIAEALVAGAMTGGEQPGADAMQRATRLYAAIKTMVDEREADAATTNCGPVGDAFGAVPCIALMLLQEAGLPAACQGDIDALLTMMLLKRITGWTSFMGGAWNRGGRLAVTHCALSRRMTGPAAETAHYSLVPYHHHRPDMPTVHTDPPLGQTVTVARLTRNLESLLLTTGTLVDSQDIEDRCCNTLVIDVPDVAGLLAEIQGIQHHMVVAAGDHAEALAELCERDGIAMKAFC
jgi:L-fucose isomerase-like protein